MRALGRFIIRLVAYAFVLGVVSRIAEWLWVAQGLDGSTLLQPLHDNAITTLLIAPLVLAIFGIGFLRPIAIFIAAFLCGAVLTAPFALVRLIGT